MILFIIGLSMVIFGFLLMTMGLWYKPYMKFNSWGEPEPSEACGWCVIICLAFFFGGLILFVGLAVLGGGQ